MKFINLLSVSLLLSNVVYSDFDTKKIFDELSEEQRVIIPIEQSEQRKWDFSFYQLSRDRSTVYEWVPRGEKSDQWTKLIQIQFIPLDGDDISAKDFGKAFIGKLKDEAPDAVATITPQSKDRVFIEWSVPFGTQDISAQNEISEFISTTDGIYRIAYTEKVPSMDSDVKKLWTQRLKEVKLGDQPVTP